MSRPQDIYFDYHARQQYLRDRTRAPSRRPKRRWPPFPTAEDEDISLAHEFKPDPPHVGGREARSRGALDQQPIILDVDPQVSTTELAPSKDKETKGPRRIVREVSTSSDESSEPETPIDSDNGDENINKDRRYVFIPQEGVEIPLTYDEPRTPIHAKPPQPHARAAPERGRIAVPKLDTDLPRAKSTHDVPVRLERERSPYRSVPKTKELPVHGDFLLSPEAITPKPKHHEKQLHHTMPAERSPMAAIHNQQEGDEQNLRSPTRPSMPRQRSAMAYPGKGAAAMKSPTQKEQNPLRHDPYSPSHRDGLRLEPLTPGSPRRSSAIPSSILSSRATPPDHHRQSSVPLPTGMSVSTYNATPPHVPLSGFAGQQSLNAMLASPLQDRRRASPRNSPRSSPQASPSSSPFSSPARTPPTEAGSRKSSYIESVKTSGSNSRPSSALHPPATQYLEHLNEDGSDQRCLRPAMRSRQTSPLPALPTGHLEANPAPRIDIRSPSPANRHRSSSHAGDHERSRSQRPEPSASPSAQDTQTQTFRPATLEQRRRSSSAVDNRPRLTIDSSRAQDTVGTSSPRHLSLKSPNSTRAASVGAPPATLPPCSRPVPVGGYNDWYSLYDYPDFKVCPSCREAVSDAGYGRHLRAVFTKSPERHVQCSFSIPWIRMAYLLMVKKRRSDVNLLYDMADVAEDTPPCPGKRPSTRDWYRIHDIDSDRNVPGFYACPYCVQSLQTIFPVLKGIFHKPRSNSRHSLDERTCSLRSDSSRFAIYVDLLEDTANQANEYRRSPNTYRFLELVKSMEVVPACARDTMMRGKHWHTIPKLPEFTACPECYEDVVWPAVLQGFPLASQLSRQSQVVGKAVSCQLYSSKMRNVFREACEDGDFEFLKRMAVKRWRVERDLQARIVDVSGLRGKEREEVMEEIVDEWAEWDQ
ncbi:MAG: hypothetical protein Q9166_003577 [cf. Caloplaca sp. 2 TL-2023]